MSGIDEDIAEIAERYDKEEDQVRSDFEEKLAHIREADVIGIEEDDYETFALSGVKSSYHSAERTGGFSGEAEEVPILSIGNALTTDSWGQDNDHVMVGVGIAAPEDTENENRPPGVAVCIMNESEGMDIGAMRRLWKWGQHIRGWFDVTKMTDSYQDRDRTYYLLQSTDRSKAEEADFSDSLPSTLADVREFINEHYVRETFALQPGPDNPKPSAAQALSREDEEDFGSQWADLRRFRGQVVDDFKRLPEDCEPDENPFGKYVLIDDTVATPDEIEAEGELVTDEDVENGRTPGLQVMLPPEAVEYGMDSTLEVYGTLQRDDETGQISMRGAGVCPIIPYPRDDGSEEGEDSAEVESL